MKCAIRRPCPSSSSAPRINNGARITAVLRRCDVRIPARRVHNHKTWSFRSRNFHVLITSMQFGRLRLNSNLFLSPLAGYTNLPFRTTLREIGGLDLATTDLVNARSLLEKREKALKLIETSPVDRPLAVQLFGSVPEEMRDAAIYLESIGISSVDINMGCPGRKVCRVGGGSAMMTELDKTACLVKSMVDAVKIPIT